MWKSSVQFSKVIFSSCLSFTSLCHFVVTPFNMGMRMANMRTIMTMGIMMGVDLVQVGLEDAYWRWPHRDELIESSAESVKWAVDIANVMGRRVVTDPNEARKIMGIKLTSKLG